MTRTRRISSALPQGVLYFPYQADRAQVCVGPEVGGRVDEEVRGDGLVVVRAGALRPARARERHGIAYSDGLETTLCLPVSTATGICVIAKKAYL